MPFGQNGVVESAGCGMLGTGRHFPPQEPRWTPAGVGLQNGRQQGPAQSQLTPCLCNEQITQIVARYLRRCRSAPPQRFHAQGITRWFAVAVRDEHGEMRQSLGERGFTADRVGRLPTFHSKLFDELQQRPNVVCARTPDNNFILVAGFHRPADPSNTSACQAFPSTRSVFFAASISKSSGHSAAHCAQNAGLWSMCLRCATSWATTYSRTSSPAKINRQQKFNPAREEQLPQRGFSYLGRARTERECRA